MYQSLEMLVSLVELENQLRIQKSYLVFRQTGSSYPFCSIVPEDLQSLLSTKEFQLSLRCEILK